MITENKKKTFFKKITGDDTKKTKRLTEIQVLREHQQKTFITLSGFWLLRGWGLSVNLLKQENL